MGKIDTSLFPMEIGRVAKTKKDVYIVSVNEYNGKMYIDVRLHYYVNESETLPTKKGITLNLRTFEPVAKLLIEAYKALEELEKGKNATEETEESPEE
jgi:hypothetical protein